jgi:hypothetical protein
VQQLAPEYMQWGEKADADTALVFCFDLEIVSGVRNKGMSQCEDDMW